VSYMLPVECRWKHQPGRSVTRFSLAITIIKYYSTYIDKEQVPILEHKSIKLCILVSVCRTLDFFLVLRRWRLSIKRSIVICIIGIDIFLARLVMREELSSIDKVRDQLSRRRDIVCLEELNRTKSTNHCDSISIDSRLKLIHLCKLRINHTFPLIFRSSSDD
jgi:hypothetical protein